MAKTKTKPLDLVEACRNLQPANKGWRHRATEEQRAQMEKLKAAYQSGEVVAPIRKIHQTVNELLGLSIGRDSLTEFLHEGRSGQPAKR